MLLSPLRMNNLIFPRVKYSMLSAQRIEFISLMPNTLNHMQLVLMGFA